MESALGSRASAHVAVQLGHGMVHNLELVPVSTVHTLRRGNTSCMLSTMRTQRCGRRRRALAQHLLTDADAHCAAFLQILKAKDKEAEQVKMIAEAAEEISLLERKIKLLNRLATGGGGRAP